MEMDDLATWTESVEVIDGWRCIGCGRVEASRPCVGICQDRRARLVELDNFVAALERAESSEARVSALESFARLVAATSRQARRCGSNASRVADPRGAMLASVTEPNGGLFS